MIPSFPPALVNHLWQSTLFGAAVWALTIALRGYHARLRYWLWVTASIKFLVPFAWLIAVSAQIEWRTAPVIAPPAAALVIDQVLTPAIVPSIMPRAVASPALEAVAVAAVWLVGVAVVCVWWWRQWQPVREARRSATRLSIESNVLRDLPVMCSPMLTEPGVVGVWRPVLLVPDGLLERLTAGQRDALFAHERSHVRHHDNVIAMVHMVIEALFWFHPLVWWIERRLIDERERACDEDVVTSGHEADVYAEGILAVCRLTVRTSLPCVAGVSGSNLRRRIETIMGHVISRRLSVAGRCALLAVVIVAVGGPVIAGVLAAPARAQRGDGASRAQFEVASIKRSPPNVNAGSMRTLPTGEATIVAMPLRVVISNAYLFDDVVGLPSWIATDRYDVHVKPAATASLDQQRQMWTSLLADRLQLVAHYESRDVPGYALVISRPDRALGTRLKPAVIDCSTPQPGRGLPTVEEAAGRCGLTSATGFMASGSVTMEQFASRMRYAAGRPVMDATGLSGRYALTLTFSVPPPAGSTAPPSGTADAPDIFTALQEQLGLRLQSSRVPIQVLVIDHIERPTED